MNGLIDQAATDHNAFGLYSSVTKLFDEMLVFDITRDIVRPNLIVEET